MKNRPAPGHLKLRRMSIDTWRDHICFLHSECTAYPAPDYLGPNRVDISSGAEKIRARVNVVDDDRFVRHDEIGLSKRAYDESDLLEGPEITIERATPPDSLLVLRSKVAGKEFGLG